MIWHDLPIMHHRQQKHLQRGNGKTRHVLVVLLHFQSNNNHNIFLEKPMNLGDNLPDADFPFALFGL